MSAHISANEGREDPVGPIIKHNTTVLDSIMCDCLFCFVFVMFDIYCFNSSHWLHLQMKTLESSIKSGCYHTRFESTLAFIDRNICSFLPLVCIYRCVCCNTKHHTLVVPQNCLFVIFGGNVIKTNHWHVHTIMLGQHTHISLDVCHCFHEIITINLGGPGEFSCHVCVIIRCNLQFAICIKQTILVFVICLRWTVTYLRSTWIIKSSFLMYHCIKVDRHNRQ